jgi:VCBS repeat protein
LIINVTYDASVNSAPAAFKTAIATVVQFFDNTFTNPITINIDVGYGEIGPNNTPLGSGALGESNTFFNSYSYSAIRNAMVTGATSADQTSAANSLPVADPTGGGNFWMATAEAKALRLQGASSAVDGYVGFSSTFPFTYNNSTGVAPGTYDFFGTAAHEFSEVMGRELFVGSDGIGSNSFTPLDLFHYSSQNVRDFSGPTAGYFSIDGGRTNLDNFNTDPNGDFGDWASSAGFKDSFLAFSNSGVVNAVSQNDLRELNALGYDETPPPPLKFVGTGDFVAGGNADIAWQNGNGAMLWVDNGGAFSQVAVPNASMGPEWTASGIGDFNGDGNADVLWTNASGQAAVWEMNGANLIGFGMPAGQMGAEWHVAAIGDFNGDHKSDLLWVTTSSQVAVWTMNGTALAGFAISNGAMGAEWHIVGTGDFNQDGRSDVLWVNNSGNVDIWEMNGANLSGFVQNVATAPANSHFAGVGHFSGSAGSTSDIVWVDSTNHVTIWQTNNGHVANVVTLNGLDGTEWHLEGVGNFANDANSDLLWVNNAGAVHIWEVNGSNAAEISMAAPTGDTLQLHGGANPPPAQAGGPGGGTTPVAITQPAAQTYVLYSPSNAGAPVPPQTRDASGQSSGTAGSGLGVAPVGNLLPTSQSLGHPFAVG